MQRPRHMKSRSASGIEAVQKVNKSEAASRLSTDSCHHAYYSNANDMLTYRLVNNSWEQEAGLPMKLLLAEEMSKESETKRRSYSVIARLMGLEVSPFPENLQRQQQKRTFHSPSTRGNSTEEQQAFKGVYEDLESTHIRFSSIFTEPRDMGLDYIDSSKKLLEKFLNQRDPVFVNPVHEPRAADRKSSVGRKIAVLKPSNPDNFSGEAKTRVDVSGKPPKILLQAKNEEHILPTRIVVLKPNVGKMQQRAGLSNSSPVDSRVCPNGLKKMEEEEQHSGRTLRRRKHSCNKMGSLMPMCEETRRELARVVARKMRDASYKSMDTNNTSTGLFGYAGDESSCDPDETDPESESEAFPPPSGRSFGHSRYINKSTNKEAKKRLSERWRITGRYRDFEAGSNSRSTLGEMLSLPDRVSRAKYLRAASLGHTSNKLNAAAKEGPLGISSSDGWNNAAAIRRVNGYESCEGHMMQDKFVRCSRSKSAKGTHSHRGKKPLACSRMFIEEDESSSSGASFETETTSNTEDILEDPHTFPTDSKTATFESRAYDEMMMTVKPRSTLLSSNNADLLQEQPRCIVEGTSAAQHRESSQSSKEADHPSPVSVLEVPFSPSSESFERVSDELHGLRTQLQLLKMVSPGVEEQMSPPTPSNASHKQKLAAAEGWEIPYALDVLAGSGIEESHFNVLRTTTLFSHDSVLNPELFVALEDKYGGDEATNGSRHERRLLFDGINSSLLEIFHERVDFQPWAVMPKLAGFHSKPLEESVRDAIEELISGNLPKEEMLEAVLDREMRWLHQKGEIDAIGREIESILIDEMTSDVICSYNAFQSC